MHSSGVFSDKAYCKVDLKREILGSHMISDQSLLLSTIVLNDTYLFFCVCYPISVSCIEFLRILYIYDEICAKMLFCQVEILATFERLKFKSNFTCR